MFDESWHQIRLLVTEADVTLYIDDQEIERKPLHPVLGIYISGLTQIGKYSGKEETVQVCIFRILLYGKLIIVLPKALLFGKLIHLLYPNLNV